jgi:hypothetical protein
VREKSRLHAERLRQFTDASNAVHEQYLSDPELLRQYEEFLSWQIAYSLPFYSEFEEHPETAAAVEFVISDLIGTGISARDADIARIIPIMIRLLPARALQATASAMELNARALAINLDICQHLSTPLKAGTGITEREYCLAFRESTSLDECRELIDLTVTLGHTLKRLVHNPMLHMTLRAMHYPAHAAGFGAMQDFLEKGDATFRAIDDIDYFLDRFAERMLFVFTRICEEPLENLSSSTRSSTNISELTLP